MSDEKPNSMPWEFMANNLDFIGDMMPQSKAIGAKYYDVTKGRAKAKLPWREDLLGNKDLGIIASGAVLTLIDQTCGTACMAALDRPGTLATLDLRVDYMRAAKKGNTIYANAHCYRVTNNIAFVRAIAYESEEEIEDNIICAAQACFMLNSDAPMAGVKI